MALGILICTRNRFVFIAIAAVAALNEQFVLSLYLHPSLNRMMISSTNKSLASSSKLFFSAAAPAQTIIGDIVPLNDPSTKPFNPGPTISLNKRGTAKMNLFGFYYGLVACIFGIFWFIGLSAMDLIYKIFPNYDPTRRIPVFIGNVYGHVLAFLTRCYPIVKGRENISNILGKDEQKSPRACMFVANHCSWLDVLFLGCSVIGMNNYKMVSKTELLKVPILSKSLKVSDHVILDRKDRKSQLQAYKKGIHYLKQNVHLVTFAEGTRSRDGRLQPFKRGAFKMAQATGSPIVPVSIKYAHLVNPVDFAWPMRSAMSVPAEVIIGKPIETTNKDDDQLLIEVRQAIIDNLPESQRPKPDTPSSA